MKGPLTRRRERRILAALQVLGPLSEFDLSDFLGTPQFWLRKPLLNLVLEKKITATKQTSIISPGYFTWSIADQENPDG